VQRHRQPRQPVDLGVRGVGVGVGGAGLWGVAVRESQILGCGVVGCGCEGEPDFGVWGWGCRVGVLGWSVGSGCGVERVS